MSRATLGRLRSSSTTSMVPSSPPLGEPKPSRGGRGRPDLGILLLPNGMNGRKQNLSGVDLAWRKRDLSGQWLSSFIHSGNKEKNKKHLVSESSRKLCKEKSKISTPDVSFRYRGMESCKKVAASLKSCEPWGNMAFWTNAAGPGWKLSFAVEPWTKGFSTSCAAPYSAGATEHQLSLDEKVDNSTVASGFDG